LSTALQETNSNADDLKKQLQYYKDECTRLRNNHNNKQENMDDMDEVSSSTSNNILFNNTNKINNANTKNNAKFKQELVKLTDSFDRKCKELNEIRDQMRKLVNEFN
jgi:predicted  nucleic acid-binding Zn-ribbon protein